MLVYGRLVKHFGLVPVGAALTLSMGAAACGGAPEPRTSAASAASLAAPAVLAQPVVAAVAMPGDCDPEPGKPPPEPLARAYTGVAAKARCQREVYTIMAGVTRSLGVECQYCHLVPDYKAMTHRKEIANWMASDLIPALQLKTNGALPWCNNCHSADGKGVAKILGDPRRPSFAVEWMTTHLVEDFQTKNGSPLHCKSCHQGNVGTPEFHKQVILTKSLPQ